MAENYLPGTVGHIHRLNQLRKSMGRSPLYEFLKDFAIADRVYQRWDFTENAAIADYPLSVAKAGGTSDANFAIKAATENGVIEADTGTDDNNSLSLIGSIQLFGDRNAGVAFRFKVDDVSEANVELGLIDAVPAANASGVTDEDTPSFAAADCALFAWDTDETYTGLGTYTEGSTANQDVKRTSITSVTLEDATWYWAAIQLLGNSAYFYWGKTPDTMKLVSSHNDDPQGNLEGGVALAPWFYARTRNTTAKFPQIDVLEYWHDRN